MATISINGMRFYAYHGCFDQERAIGTHFEVDLRLEADTDKAQLSDSIADTVNYLEVYQVVKEEMERPSNLLENVAYRIGKAVVARFDTNRVKVCVRKLNPPLGGQIDSVGVEMEVTK